ncbi:MAG: PrsW family glutamic-type intramembrane protease, partial [Alkalispirochaeta sp.]
MLVVLHTVNILVSLVLLAFLDSRLRHINDKRQEHVVWAFVVGGMFSTFLVLILYEMYPPRLGYLLGASEVLFHIFVVGMVEETGKFLSFLFIVHVVGRIREPQDGAVYGAIVGLTFGVVENMAYFSWYQSWGLISRPFLVSPGHAIYGAIWGGIYSQAIYTNRADRDVGTIRNSVISIVGVAVLHGVYNASTRFFPVALVVDLSSLAIAIVLFRKLVELSPYRVYPLSEATAAIRAIKRGLVFNRKSPYLNRNMGLYLMRRGEFRSAAEHLRASVPRTKDRRRVRFLAAACDTMHVPEYHAHRGLRIAWSRLTDEQRTRFMAQLSSLVGPDHPIVENVNAFISEAFKPRHSIKPHDIARTAKIKRLERRRPRRSTQIEDAVAEL